LSPSFEFLKELTKQQKSDLYKTKGAVAIAKWFPFWGGFCPCRVIACKWDPRRKGPKFIQRLVAKQKARVKAVGDNGCK